LIELFKAFFDIATDGLLDGIGEMFSGVCGAAIGTDAEDGIWGQVCEGLIGA
jgi:hypothetical protein